MHGKGATPAWKDEEGRALLGLIPLNMAELIEEFQLARIIGKIQPLGCIMAGDMGPTVARKKKDHLSPKQIRQISHRADRRKERQNLNKGNY